MPTKLETVYKKIKNEVAQINEIYKYPSESAAFGHFCIKNIFNVDDQVASESITDDFHDNGIDAIYISEDSVPVLNFFEFKFPKTENNLCDGFTDEEIVKLGDGTRTFLCSKELDSEIWNEYLIDKHNIVKELESYKIKLWAVRYTNAQITHQNSKLAEQSKHIYRSTLNECDPKLCGAQDIMELYESRYEKIYPNIELNVVSSVQPQVYETDGFKSTHTVVSISELYKAVSDHRDKIFDGNVRYYNSKTDVTTGIRSTLRDYPEKFMLLNNGITILAEETKYNVKTSKLILKSASIINGAQTVGSIIEVLDQIGEEKYAESAVLVRILEINNEESINDIVNSLNTQTKMFSAYNISKDTRLRNVQSEINSCSDTPYFLEIKYNEFNTLKKNGKTRKFKKDVISSEKLIQLFTAYENLKSKASLAKSNSSELLKDDELVNNALDNLTKDNSIKIIDLYKKIQNIITDYRIYRNTKKDDIIKFLKIRANTIDNYQFLTTGDILVLFATSIVKKYNNDLSDEEVIKIAIRNISEYIKTINKDGKKVVSNITKSKATFDGLRAKLYKKYSKKEII